MSAAPSPRVKRSMEIFRRAKELIPGGTQLISRRPSRFAYGITPVYAERAQGAHIWDVDGHEYVDWCSSAGAIILERNPTMAHLRRSSSCFCSPIVRSFLSNSRLLDFSLILAHDTLSTVARNPAIWPAWGA